MSVATALVRLFSIGLIIHALNNASFYIQVMLQSDLYEGFGYSYALISGVFIPVLIAFLIWVFPQKVTGGPVSRTGDEPEGSLQTINFFSVGVALIGLYLATLSASAILEWLLRYREQKQLIGEMFYETSMSYVDLVGEMFLLLIGLLLFFGVSTVTRLFHYLKHYRIES